MAKKRIQSITFTDQIRSALANCGETRYRVAKNSGLTEPQLCRFAAGGGISMSAFDTLAEYLGLEIIIRKKGKDRWQL